MDIIKVENASKSFNNYKVLDNVSLSCEAGKIYGIVGYNGSGKTVLFKCICGFYHLDEGEIWIRGKKMKKILLPLSMASLSAKPALLLSRSPERRINSTRFLTDILTFSLSKNLTSPEHLYIV